MTPSIVLSIAGSDSAAGAGIQADLKTAAALGCYAATAITAITAQNTQGVRAVLALPTSLIADQIDAVFADLDVRAVKIGMVQSAEVVAAIAAALERHQPAHVVLDPVMVASSGASLMAPDTLNSLRALLFPKASLITPNLDEARILAGLSMHDQTPTEALADLLRQEIPQPLLLKDGHGQGSLVRDLLCWPDGRTQVLEQKRLNTRNTHGTGCSLSTAIACGLAQGHALDKAVAQAQAYVHGALAGAQHWRLGLGPGPLNHFAQPLYSRPDGGNSAEFF